MPFHFTQSTEYPDIRFSNIGCITIVTFRTKPSLLHQTSHTDLYDVHIVKILHTQFLLHEYIKQGILKFVSPWFTQRSSLQFVLLIFTRLTFPYILRKQYKLIIGT